MRLGNRIIVKVNIGGLLLFTCGLANIVGWKPLLFLVARNGPAFMLIAINSYGIHITYIWFAGDLEL
jgi:hypothetical protein